MPCWRFSNEDKTVACEVTKQGGYISYFLKSRISESTELTNEQGVKAAEDFLDDLGILSMKTTYYENIDNVLTVNFAFIKAERKTLHRPYKGISSNGRR